MLDERRLAFFKSVEMSKVLVWLRKNRGMTAWGMMD
jgi:hypothetical protein